MIPREEHSRVLANAHDVPEEAPSFKIGLTSVGISGKTVWVRLPSGQFPFDADISVSLPATSRGIHMSRIEEAISSLYERSFDDLCSYAKVLAGLVIERQKGNMARINLKGKIPVQRTALVSNRISTDTLDIEAQIEAVRLEAGVKFKEMAGLTVFHITACPCTQAYNQELFRVKDNLLPLITHSQRSLTRLLVERQGGYPSYEDIFKCLEVALHITQDLLKRSDEAEIVIKAHLAPQFIEDTVRQTAREVYVSFVALLPPQTEILIESRSLESIHIHDVCCTLKTTLGEIAHAI
ncbi:MAG: GTP cyclohydrolase, FolE2/MptA family [Dissulfurimicrobium sp.]|uniref:GTP cyclohydrolase, FolE2/MptA family n=1 Tax=Dissulfurimicrobium sp. TaxID=2022436 RepID=UPI00404AD41D